MGRVHTVSLRPDALAAVTGTADGAADTQKLVPSQSWRPGLKVSPGHALPGTAGKNPVCLFQLLVATGILGVPWLVDTWLHSVFTRGSV